MSLGVGEIARRLNADGSGLTVMFLDACREYAPGRGGLVEEPVPDNTFIGFATIFGNVAGEPRDTGTYAHSYYTAALLRALDAGMDNLEDLHLQVAGQVIDATENGQSPVYREGARMPTAPIRLAVNDPQTAYALSSQRRAAEGDALAARCAAMSDMRLIFSFSNGSSMAGPMEAGPRYEPVDLALTETACRSAYAAGHRDPAVLRGDALTQLLRMGAQGERPSGPLADQAYAMLAEAAEAGDPLSNMVLAVSQNSLDTALVRLNLPINAIRDRLLSAAERDQPPLTGIVGLILWRPEGAELRTTLGLPQDPELGFQLFRRAVLSGDPLLQPLAISMRLKRDPAVADLDLRSGLRRALDSPSSVGFYFEGLTVHQSLYLFALLDAYGGVLGPEDPAEVVRLALEAEPFLAKLGQAYVRGTGRPNAADGFLTAAACILASGRDQQGLPVPGIMPDRELAMRLVAQISDNPPAELRTSIDQLAHGGTCD